MLKETKNAALTTAQAFYHQSIVALDKCFEMEKEIVSILKKMVILALLLKEKIQEAKLK